MSEPCQLCGRNAPTAHITLYRNLGLLVARHLTTTTGFFCRSCARDKWLSETLLTSVIGWWGIISFFVNIFAVLNNLAQAPKVFSIPADADADALGLRADPGRAPPKTGKVLLGIVGVVGACVALLVGVSVWSSGARGRRLAELEQKVGQPRTAPELAQSTACDLAELQLLKGLGSRGPVSAYSCRGPLKAEGDRALLEGVAGRSGQPAFAVCLKRSPERWFVAGVGGCARAELSQNPALSIDAQEDAWRRAESRSLVAEVRQGLDRKLLAITTTLEADDVEVPACSSKVLEGYVRPTPHSVKTVDASVLMASATVKGAQLPYLTSQEVKDALSKVATEGQLEAILALDSSKLLAVIEPSVTEPPSLTGTREFETGMFIGQLVLVDPSKGAVLCSRVLAFQSSKDISIMTGKYASESTKATRFRERLASDFEAQYRKALGEALVGAWKSEAQAQEDELRALQELIGKHDLDLEDGEQLYDSRNDEPAVGKKVALQSATPKTKPAPKTPPKARVSGKPGRE